MWDEEIPDVNSGPQDDNPDAPTLSLPDVIPGGGGGFLEFLGGALKAGLDFQVSKDQAAYNRELMKSGRAIYDPASGRFYPTQQPGTFRLPSLPISGGSNSLILLLALAAAGYFIIKKA